MAKYLKEQQAWEFLAKLCRGNLIKISKGYAVYIGETVYGEQLYRYGLCPLLSSLVNQPFLLCNEDRLPKISYKMYDKMHKALLRYKPLNKLEGSYWWPKTKAGYAKRAAICDKCAVECAAEASRKPKKPAQSKKRPPLRLSNTKG